MGGPSHPASEQISLPGSVSSLESSVNLSKLKAHRPGKSRCPNQNRWRAGSKAKHAGLERTLNRDWNLLLKRQGPLRERLRPRAPPPPAASGDKGGRGCPLLLVGMRHGMIALKEFLTKLNTILPNNPAITRLDIYPTELKTYVHTKSLTQTSYSRFIHNQPKLEAIKMSLAR